MGFQGNLFFVVSLLEVSWYAGCAEALYQNMPGFSPALDPVEALWKVDDHVIGFWLDQKRGWVGQVIFKGEVVFNSDLPIEPISYVLNDYEYT